MNKKLLIPVFVVLIGFTACQKDLSSDGFVLYTGNAMNDTVWTRITPASAAINEIVDSVSTDTFIDSISLDKADTIKFGAGFQLIMPGNNNTGGGNPPNPEKVRVEIKRLQTKGDLLRSLQHTVTDHGRLLETVGVFIVKVTYRGNEIVLSPNSNYKIRFSDTAELKQNLQVFTGMESNFAPRPNFDSSFAWSRNGEYGMVNTWYNSANTSGNTKGYDCIIKNFRWFAIGKYIDSSAAKVKLSVILPPNYTNKNTVAFAVLKNSRTIISLKPDYNSRSFAGVNVPANTPFTIVTITKIGATFYLGSRMIGDASGAPAFSITPEQKTVTQLIQFLNTL